MNTQPTATGKPGCVSDLLLDAIARLSETLALSKQIARLEARILAACAWNVAPSWPLAHDTDSLNHEQVTHFQTLLHRRLNGEPIAYITAYREFYGRPFHVTPDVLIPRPETELLVELALAHIPHDHTIEVLELGTGSGCIAISLALERPRARITAVERSSAALDIAKINAGTLNAELELLKSDWFAAVQQRKFDLIVSNPPYVAIADPHLCRGDVRFEPFAALQAGSEGTDDLQYIIAMALRFLKPGGSVFLEHGFDQRMAVQNFMQRAGYTDINHWQDLSNRDRVSSGKASK
jgi:release factor glutamine methyltransferase